MLSKVLVILIIDFSLDIALLLILYYLTTICQSFDAALAIACKLFCSVLGEPFRCSIRGKER